NPIHSNTGLGIDLGGDGVTPNDPGDADTGSNGLQNFPDLTAAFTNGTTTTIRGTLNSIASRSFDLDFFSNPACDASTHGQGASFIGSLPVSTDSSGNITFAATFSLVVPAGQVVTATATDASGNTSEFSVCRTVAAAPPNSAPTASDDLATTALNSAID